MTRSRGGIATPHYLATSAGEKALARGGSAIDAAIAAAAVLAVVYPHMTGLGGDSWSLIRTPQGDTHALNGTGRHPRSVEPEQLRQRFGAAMPLLGPEASPVPGAVSAWGTMHELAGRLSWGELLEDAITLASAGAPVASALARDLASLWDELGADPGLRAVFSAPDGGPMRAGDCLIQPALSESLRAIASDGPGAFYSGALADRLTKGLQRLGSAVTQSDFLNQESELLAPISRHYRDHLVSTAPPNSQGFTLLQLLATLEQAGVDLDDTAHLGIAAALFSLANSERESYLADPAHGEIDVEWLLSSEHIDALVHAAQNGQLSSSAGKPRASGDTIGIAAIDESGWAISSLHSIFYAFGARVLEPQTGIVLQNRSASFSLDPSHPAYLRGGARPPSTLLPVFVDHPDGRLSAVASMGGRSQAQIQSQLISRLTKGHHPQDVTEMPRFVVGSFGPSLENAAVIERGLGDGKQASEIGLLVVAVNGQDDRCGHSQIVQRDTATFLVGTDPRADGKEPA